MTASTQNTKVGIQQGGNSLCVKTGGTIDLDTGADILVNGVSLIDEVAALSGLDSGELGVINGVTAGTVTASKAVVVDANKDIGDFRHVTLTGNIVIGATTLSETDLAKTDGITNGTQAANKAVVTDANVNSGVSKVTQLWIGATGAEVQVGATPAEIDAFNDVSAYTETVAAAGAVSVTKKATKLALVGAGAVTLAAPSAASYGMVKIIEMTADNGDVTLALTNVQGQSSGTTATFNDVGDTLTVIGGTSKWNVLGESGITLS